MIGVIVVMIVGVLLALRRDAAREGAGTEPIAVIGESLRITGSRAADTPETRDIVLLTRCRLTGETLRDREPIEE